MTEEDQVEYCERTGCGGTLKVVSADPGYERGRREPTYTRYDVRCSKCGQRPFFGQGRKTIDAFLGRARG
jgi:hypothetical protein